jgi:flagellar motor switch protein FliM
LIGALGAFGNFVAGSTSCTGGSSAVIFSIEGAMVASLFGSSSSLQRKPKERDFTQLERRKISKKEHRVVKILTSPRG